ncbi:MAG: transglutaminase family protein [Gaiellaceae bacterium]
MRSLRVPLVCLVPGVALMLSWLRLEQPQRDGWRVLLLLLLSLVPALAPRAWQRLALFAAAMLVATAVATDASAHHPWRAAPRLWDGFLDAYDVKLPFDPSFHVHFHALLLLAGFVFAAGVALAASFGRPLVAVGVFIVGATWPATLLTNDRDLLRGAIVLGVSLFLLAALREHPLPSFGRAALLGAGLVAAALAAATQPAVAKSEFLHWQTWKPISRPPAQVGVRYVWDSNYDGFTWPRKTTTVFKVQASPRSLYWRSTTLDLFTGARWVEYRQPERAELFDNRLDLTQNDPLAPSAARDPATWKKAQFEIASLADDHLVAPSVPVAYEPVFSGADFFQGGSGTLSGELERGQRYAAWSYSPHPTSAQLAATGDGYGQAALPYLEVYPSVAAPPFGTTGREAAMRRFFAEYPNYRALYAQARRVVGNAQSPYAAVLALESWLRSTGGFAYTQHPPRARTEPLLDFVLRTKRGYCQHFAGAMTLMLRYLGIPARVAEGFTSGVYDTQSKTWTVTDHDAHAWVEVWFERFGWLPFDPTPGRGSLSAAYSVSSPDFRIASAQRFISGVAASLLNTAALHQDVSFGEKNPGVIFRGTDIRPAKPSAGGAFGIQQRGGSLGKFLAVVLAVAIGLLALVKAARRHLRYATPDPRRQAAACRADLRDFLADQRIRVAPSAAPEEVAALLRSELEVDASRFTAALAAARFAPLPDAEPAATRAREELVRLREQLRRRLGLVRRVRGLVSLRSLGFTG